MAWPLQTVYLPAFLKHTCFSSALPRWHGHAKTDRGCRDELHLGGSLEMAGNPWTHVAWAPSGAGGSLYMVSVHFSKDPNVLPLQE